MKSLRLLSVILSILLLAAAVLPASVFAVDPDYYVAGDNIFGNWESNKNKMTKGSDGKYTFSITTTEAVSTVNFKVTDGASEWIGDDSGNNIMFAVKGAGEIVITFDPVTKAISISGSAYAKPTFEYSSVTAVGTGSGSYLNGIEWDPQASSNHMTKVEDDVWEIEYKDVAPAEGYKLKFALDDSWSKNFGGSFSAFGVSSTANFDGGDIYFSVVEECTLKIRLDLRNFDLSTRSGATFMINAIAKNSEGSSYYVVGTDPLAGWDTFEDGNIMTLGNDGLYSATFSAQGKVDRIELKVVKLVDNDLSKKIWYGNEKGNNYAISLSDAGEFTVTFNPDTSEVKVTGDKVTVALETGDAAPVYIAVAAAVIMIMGVAVVITVRRRRRIEF